MIAEGYAAGELQYRVAQLGELAFLGIWGGVDNWPLSRIRREFAEQTAYMRHTKKVEL